MGVTAKSIKHLIGKRVRADYPIRGGYVTRGYQPMPREGILQETSGRNCRIDGDWYWLPDMKSVTEVKEAEDEQGI